jgi:hypothetical protein
LFPSKKIKGERAVQLHARLADPAAWAALPAYPAQLAPGDLGSHLQGEARSIALNAARSLQHAALRAALLQCGLQSLVVRLHDRHSAMMQDQDFVLQLRTVCEWSTHNMQAAERHVRELVAHARADCMSAWVVPAPLYPTGTPPVTVLDDALDKDVKKLIRRRGPSRTKRGGKSDYSQQQQRGGKRARGGALFQSGGQAQGQRSKTATAENQ